MRVLFNLLRRGITAVREAKTGGKALAASETCALGNASVGELKTLADEPGLRILEQVRGDKLFHYEKRVIDGKSTSTIQVFEGKGECIGKGNDGLSIDRTKTIQVENGESIFGGNRIIIDKNYNETMAMTKHQDKLVKEYSPEGIYEHGERCLKYRCDEQPKITKYDRIKYANGQTPYSEALKAKNAEAAKAAEEKAAAEAAAKAAEEKAAAELAAKMPRVNTHKLMGRDISEFRMVEETAADGSVTRYFYLEGCNEPAIKTFDHNGVHEEWAYRGPYFDSMHSKFSDCSEFIEMKNGNVRNMYNAKYEYRIAKNGNRVKKCSESWDEQTYNDGLIQIRKTGNDKYHGTAEITMPDGSTIKTTLFGANYFSDYRNPGIYVHGNDINAWFNGGKYGVYTDEVVNYINKVNERLSEIFKEMQSKQVDLENLYKPFQS